MLTFAIPTTRETGSHKAAVIKESLGISTQVLGNVLIDEEINWRYLDENEKHNLTTSSFDTPNAEVDIKDYVVCQNIERREFDVPSSSKLVSVISGPTQVKTPAGGIVYPFGFSISEFGESAIALDKILGDIPKRLQKNAAKILAYTVIHETGHLYGLVNERRRRTLVGRHCANLCVMKSTPNVIATSNCIDRMSGSIYFCRECKSDLSR